MRQGSTLQRSDGATKQVNSFVLGRYYRRSEERMNFTTEVLVKGQLNGSPLKFKATTVDISAQGLQLKLPDTVPANYLAEQVLSIHFLGLARDFVIDAKTPYSYHALGVRCKDQTNYLRLRRQTFAGDGALDKLLRGLLKTYKFRYKVNVDHVVQSLRAKGHESHWLQAQQGLPLVFSADIKKPVYTLNTAANSRAVDYWCERDAYRLNRLLGQRWVRLALAKLRSEPQQSRRQLAFYTIEVPLKGKTQCYAIPANALTKDQQLRYQLAELQQAGYPLKSMVLSLTYSVQDRLFVGLLTTLDVPQLNSQQETNTTAGTKARLKLSSLAAYCLQEQTAGPSKVVKRHPRLVQMYTQSGLCSALFVHKSQRRNSDIGLAALMPVKHGLPCWYKKAEMWLNNQYNILGGAQLKQQILDKLTQLKPAEFTKGRTLLLNIKPRAEGLEPKVTGRWLDEFTTPQQAGRFVKQQYQQQQLLAVNVELYRCRQGSLQALQDDLNYVSTYLPERADKIERQLKSIDSVIGLQDVTGPLMRMLFSGLL
ncbi:PilZ domain-containing protein [Idiomarina seosinensis]|uniref:PilZ domain-containing protein n=1 Tax=Idiomarina seosinensis TaxID=281739 RepID=UPI00384ABFF8